MFGGAGFIGSHIAEELIEHGHGVTVFVRPTTLVRLDRTLPNGAFVRTGDFCNPQDVANALEECDVAVHALSSTIPITSNQEPTFDIETNLLPSIHFLEQVRRRGVRRVMLISSGGTVYGRAATLPISEEAPTFPLCSYGIVKLALEKYLFMHSHLHGTEHIIVRLANPYGERQGAERRQGAVAVFLERVVQGGLIEIWGDGTVVRDYIYIKDAVRAVRLLLETSDAQGTFNLGTGQGTSLNELVQKIELVTGRKVEAKHLPGRTLDVPANVLDIGRIRSATNWIPSVSLEDGLRRTWEWRSRLAST